MKKNQGFTLIELLIVIAIIAILAVIVFVALDPLTRFKAARDAKRWSDATAIIEAIKVNQVDNGGTLVNAVATLTQDLYYTIGECGSDGNANCGAHATQPACADLNKLVDDGYLPLVPMDPKSGDSNKTDYFIMRTAENVITVGACDPESGNNIYTRR
jgi:type IV pilus assembly protein PilA